MEALGTAQRKGEREPAQSRLLSRFNSIGVGMLTPFKVDRMPLSMVNGSETRLGLGQRSLLHTLKLSQAQTTTLVYIGICRRAQWEGASRLRCSVSSNGNA